MFNSSPIVNKLTRYIFILMPEEFLLSRKFIIYLLFVFLISL
jgi:hypothetical protein